MTQGVPAIASAIAVGASAAARPARPLRILLTNTVALNGGEAATIKAILALLRRTFGADTRVVVYEQTPEAAAKYHPDVDFRALLWNRATWSVRMPTGRLRWWVNRPLGRVSRARFLRALDWWCAGRRDRAKWLLSREERRDLEIYSTADLVVSSGGTYLVDNYDIEPRIFDFEIAHRLGRPLVLFTQSMGPFRQDATRGRLRAALEAAKLILLRDETSLAHLHDIGVKHPNVHVAADAVFALNDPETLAARYAAMPALGGAPRVALSVRHWPYFRRWSTTDGMARYRASIAAAVTRLVRRHGARVTFLSTCQGIPEYWFDDAKVADQIVSLLEPDLRWCVEVDRGFHSPEQMVELLTTYDLVIATRFHMAILALLAGTPAMAIAYEFKTIDMYRRLGVPDWLADIEIMDAPVLVEQVERCLAGRLGARDVLARSVLAEYKRAERVGPLLRQVVSV